METAWQDIVFSGLLRALDVLSLQTFRSGLDLELYLQALIEGAVPAHLDGGEMDEDVFTCRALDKSIPLRRVEPLDYTFFFH